MRVILLLTIFIQICLTAHINQESATIARRRLLNQENLGTGHILQDFKSILDEPESDGAQNKLANILGQGTRKIHWGFTVYLNVMQNILQEFKDFKNGVGSVEIPDKYINDNIAGLNIIVPKISEMVNLLQKLDNMMFALTTYLYNGRKGYADIPNSSVNKYNNLLTEIGDLSFSLGQINADVTTDLQSLNPKAEPNELAEQTARDLDDLGKFLSVASNVLRSCKLYFEHMKLKDRANKPGDKVFKLNANEMEESVAKGLAKLNNLVIGVRTHISPIAAADRNLK